MLEPSLQSIIQTCGYVVYIYIYMLMKGIKEGKEKYTWIQYLMNIQSQNH